MDRRRFLSAVAAGTASALLPGCSSAEPDPDPTLPPPPADRLAELVAGNTAFAGDLLAARGDPADNLILSPFGVSAVFGMVSHGARGRTLEQMRQVLHLPADDTTAAGFGELTRQLNAARKAGGSTFDLSSVNAVWGQTGFPWRPEYVTALKGGYGAGVREADFTTKAEPTRQEINRFVEAQTRDRIKDLVPQGAIDRDTRMVLVNAIYFKAKWQHPFEPSNTRPHPFTTAGGTKVDARLMGQTKAYPLLETDEFQAIELPYQGGQTSLWVFLPRKADGLPGFEKQFTAAKLAEWTKASWPKRMVQVYLPKWKAETTTNLVPLLSKLGMPDLFNPDAADLSGMTTADRLFVSAAMQKAFVEVSEEGTEAAAGTFAGVKAASGGPPEPMFYANRPFLYAIRHTPTNSLLFVGRVTDPTKGGA